MKKLLSFYNTLRHDPEAVFELRQLLFGVIVLLGVTYGFYFLYVESKEKTQIQLVQRSQQLQNNLGDGTVEKLSLLELEGKIKKEKALNERVELLTFKKNILREQYLTGNSNHSFARVIFTLLPKTPVDIENEFVQMKVLDIRSLEFYKIHPVNIQGDSTFAEFLSYLQYIENRPEVGIIDTLKLEQLEPEFFGQKIIVNFDLVLGRIELNVN